MSGCKYSIWNVLSAGVALFLMLPSLALGEFGVCPPYSQTFGPDDPPEDIAAFIAEINLRPGGGTVNLEPGDYGWIDGVPPITGVVCTRTTDGDPDSVSIGLGLDIASGAIVTLRAAGRSATVDVAASGTLFAWNRELSYLRNSGAVYLNDCSFEEAYITNFGRLILRGGHISGEVLGYLGCQSPFQNHGWAMMDRVTVEVGPACDQHDCIGGCAIDNTDGGTLTLAQTTISYEDVYESLWPASYGVRNQAGAALYVTGSTFVPVYSEWELGVTNEGYAEINQSILHRCTGSYGQTGVPPADTGHNVFHPDSGCMATDPTSVEADPLVLPSYELAAGSPAIDRIPLELCSEFDALGRARTDGNGDGTIACDSGALEYGYTSVEVVVRTTPYWRSVGSVDLSSDSPLFIAVMSGGPIDPTSILFDSIAVGDFPRSAMRGISYHDKNWDGLPDYNFWYRLDRDLVLECRYYDEPFSAMTDDGQQVTGRLEFEAVGCTP